MNNRIKIYVNLNSLPTKGSIKKYTEKNTEITVGDLHACLEKLVYIFFLHGIAENLTNATYKRMCALIHKPTTDGFSASFRKSRKLTKEHIKEFINIVDQVIFSTHTHLVLLGDTMADRGACDYFTLLFMKKAIESNVDLKILISNHDIEFLLAMEKNSEFHLHNNSVYHSMNKTQKLIAAEIISREDVLEAAKPYKSCLRALHYTLDESKTSIIISSHAPIDLSSIEALAKHPNIKVKFNDTTVLKLAQTIDDINKKFCEHVDNNTLFKLFNEETLGYERPKPNEPWNWLVWNRNINQLDRDAPEEGYGISWIHGHGTHGGSDEDSDPENVVNLDNFLGNPSYLRFGWYTAEKRNAIAPKASSLVAGVFRDDQPAATNSETFTSAANETAKVPENCTSKSNT